MKSEQLFQRPAFVRSPLQCGSSGSLLVQGFLLCEPECVPDGVGFIPFSGILNYGCFIYQGLLVSLLLSILLSA